MSIRAIVIGLLGAALIAGLGYINDEFIKVNRMVSQHFPISVFGLLVLGMLTLQPLLGLLRPRWKLRPGELGLIVLFTMVGCAIPGGGLLKMWYPALVSPLWQSDVPGWKSNRVLEYAPSMLIPGPKTKDSELVRTYFDGLAEANETIGIDQVPWRQWEGAIFNWVPLILFLGVGVICLGLIVHHQWVRNERLKYPIADVATSYIRNDDGAGGRVYSERLFWVGLLVVLGIHLTNGLQAWFPKGIVIPLTLDLAVLRSEFPSLTYAHWNWHFFTPRLFLSIVAFGYFLASDIGLSLGISHFVYIVTIGSLAVAGIDVAYSPIAGGAINWTAAGAGVALAVLVCYTGRRYYRDVLGEALAFRRAQGVPHYAAVACRLFLLSAAASVAVLIWYGLQWPLAVLLVVVLFVFFLACARLSAECGQVLLKPAWEVPCIFAGLFGLTTLGPHAIILIGLVNAIFGSDARECLMPFFINGLKVCDTVKVKVARAGVGSMGVWLLCLAIGAPIALWATYNYGGDKINYWSLYPNAMAHYRAANRTITNLKGDDTLAEVNAYGPLERIANAKPEPMFLWAAGIGVAGVLVLGWLRLRVPWWPIHPVIFLVGGSWPLALFAPSFLLGWAVKCGVTWFGGAGAFHKGKVFMLGVIAGDLLGGLTFMVVGYIYFFSTGEVPPRYWVYP